MSVKYLIILCFAILLTGCYPYQRAKYCTTPNSCEKPSGVYCANNCCSCYTFVSDDYFQADEHVAPRPRHHHRDYKGYKGEG